MNLTLYRALIIISFISACLSPIADMIPGLLPQMFVDVQQAQDEALINSPFGLPLAIFAVLLIVALIVVSVGLYQLRGWAPKAALIYTMVSLPLYVLGGAWAISGFGMMFNAISVMTWGAVLTAAYFAPPVRKSNQ